MTTVSTPRVGPAEDVDEAFARIRSAGGRLTGAKRRVVELLFHTPTAHTADEFVQLLDGVDASIVYRALAQMEELGIAEHVHLGHGRAVYRRRGLSTVPVACLVCGRAVEIDRSATDGFAASVAAATGIELDLVHFPLTGRCVACRASGSDV